jgi:hypothetical protein
MIHVGPTKLGGQTGSQVVNDEHAWHALGAVTLLSTCPWMDLHIFSSLLVCDTACTACG